MERFFEEIRSFEKAAVAGDAYRDLPRITGRPLGAEVEIKGIGKVISFNTLQYLGDLGLVENAKMHLDKFGFGLACSPILLQAEAVADFHDAMADFKGYPRGSCCTFATGYNAAEASMQLLINLYTSLVGGVLVRKRPPVIVFIDAFTHVSIQKPLMPFRKNTGEDQKIRTVTYRHLDYADLAEKLDRFKDSEVDRVIVTDTIFSMHGDSVDVPVIYKLAKKYGAHIFLDSAHSDGVYGSEGRGFLFQEGIKSVDRSIFLEVGTFSKALASDRGGFMLFPPEVVNFSRKAMLNFIFSSGLAPFAAATATDALAKIRGSEGDLLRAKLHRTVQYAFSELQRWEFDTLASKSQIIPIFVGDHDLMYAMYEKLLQKGIFVGKITHPAVEKNGALLRIVFTANHDKNHVDSLVKALREVRDELFWMAKKQAI